MHALYALDGLGVLTDKQLLDRLADEHPRVREHAVRLSERVLATSPAVRARLCAMTADPDLGVRYQLAFTLGEIAGGQVTDALAKIARRDAAEKWVSLAVLTSSFGRAGELFALLAEDTAWRRTAAGGALLRRLALQTGREDRRDQVAQVLRLVDDLGAQPEDEPLTRSLVKQLTEGLTRSRSELLPRLTDAGGSQAGRVLADMIAEARSVAADDGQPAQRRAEAVRALALAPSDETVTLLTRLLDSHQPPQVQTATLQAMQRLTDARVAPAVVNAWTGLSPQVRAQAAEVLFGRPERLAVLLAAVERGTIGTSQLDPARIDMLLTHPDETTRAQAGRLFNRDRPADRSEVVRSHRDVLNLTGDAARGKQVFKRECATCHRLQGVGYDLGLPLQAIRNRGRETILLSVLDPNREVNPAYLNYVVITDDGLSLTGMITAETATSITLTRAENQADTVLRSEIDELVNTGKSIMPEGLERQLSKPDLADLIEYLMGLE